LIKFFNQEDITFSAVDSGILEIKCQNPVSYDSHIKNFNSSN